MTEYKAGSTGDAKPIATINTGLGGSIGIAVDSNGIIYVLNNQSGTVAEYAAGSKGNAEPVATIAGLPFPQAIALDPNGTIYVTEGSGVSEYAAGSTGYAKPIATIVGPDTGIGNLAEGVTVDSNGTVYFASNGNGSVTEYAAGSNGDAKPIATITGSDTGLSGSSYGIAVDPNGTIYVTNGGFLSVMNTVTEYAAGSNGDAAPVATIGNPNVERGFSFPAGIAVDTNGEIYVASDFPGSVIEYAAGSYGNAMPVATISGPGSPYGIAVDSNGNIYVTSWQGCSVPANAAAERGDSETEADSQKCPPAMVIEYAAGSNGDAVPLATISGVDTGLNGPIGIAIGSNGTIYVLNNGSSSVTEYAARSNGDAKPIATIRGSATGLNSPLGIAVDSKGKIYIANWGSFPLRNSSVTEYAAKSKGNARPVVTIKGRDTGLHSPNGIAVDSNGKIYVANGNNNTVTEYAAGSHNDAKPESTISGWKTGLASPAAIAIGP